MKKPPEYKTRTPIKGGLTTEEVTNVTVNPTTLYAANKMKGHIIGLVHLLSGIFRVFSIFSLGFALASFAAMNGMLMDTMGVMIICISISVSFVSILEGLKFFLPNVKVMAHPLAGASVERGGDVELR